MRTHLTRTLIALALTASLAACGGEEEEPESTEEPAAETPPEPEPEPAAPAFSEGDIVEVEWGGTWYISRIESVNDDGTYHVHYGGWGESHDTDVEASVVRAAPSNAAELYEQAEQPGTEVTEVGQVSEGTDVWARWGGRWYEAQVTSVEGEQAHITYPGHDESWDQDIAATELRLRQ